MVKNIEQVTFDLLKVLHNYKIVSKLTYDLECAKLEDFSSIDIRKSPDYKKLFDRLKQMNGPVLYWFEIKSNISNEDIRNAIRQYSSKENPNIRATPAIRKYFDLESKCLYVGKVKKNIWGRIIQHFGFNRNKKTQGLQLFHWAKKLNLDVCIHMVEFNPEMEDLISIFEIKLAKDLKPIIGKH